MSDPSVAPASFLERTIGQLVTAPPMPPEALPPGLLGRATAAQALMEQAWRTMFLTALCQGAILGAIAVVAVILAVVVRLNLKSAIQGAIRSAIHP